MFYVNAMNCYKKKYSHLLTFAMKRIRRTGKGEDGKNMDPKKG